MKILCLDFGGSTGWAIGSDGKLDVSGTWQIAPARGESAGMRYLNLRGRLNDCRRAHPTLGLIAYEQAHHRGAAATSYAHGYEATLQAWATEGGLEVTSVHSATIKKFICGRGNADKGAVMKAIKLRGFVAETHDEGDAIALLLLMCDKFRA